ncbi:MAG: hypothetical protein PSV35_07605 [bacterium]|nr:hypothetical protein [bacterium]
MWKILSKSLLLKVSIYIFSSLIVAISILTSKCFFDNHQIYFNDFSTIMKVSTIAAFITIIIIILLGKWGWKLVWNAPIIGRLLNRKVCPDLNGKWLGKIQSNYSEEGQMVIKDVDVIIKVDFFGFSMKLESQDNYQASIVIQADIYKDARKKTFHVEYIFESTVLSPKENDDKSFQGAARLDVKYDGNHISLEGLYWTNRASQRQLNTSGMIILTKK